MWREFWNEVRIPSKNESPYMWAIIAAGHFFVGMVIVTLLPVPAVLIAALYFIAKEIRDYRNEGRLVDGAIDTGFVFLGACLLPISAALLIATGVTFYREIRCL